VRAEGVRQIALDDGERLASFDPGFTNTAAACRSAITHVEALCEHSSLLAVAFC
jgi:hypothetical protein